MHGMRDFHLEVETRLDSAGINIFIDDGNGVPGYRDTDRELARMAFTAWSRESNGRLKFTESKQREGALIRLRWISPAGGLYGETQSIEVNGKAGAVVYVMPQVSVQGEPLASRATSCPVRKDVGTSDHAPVVATFE